LALKRALATLQKGKIPLLLAVEAGNQSMCRELLGQQTAEQLKATTDNGDAAIHLAARRRDVDMIRILVDYGTNIDMQNVSTDFSVNIIIGRMHGAGIAYSVYRRVTGRRVRGSTPLGARFSASPQTGSDARAAACTMDTASLCRG
jgi:hypothetical protein